MSSKKILDTLPLGCIGNKRNELKLLLPIIEPQITKDTIFVEPFCGSCIVSFNIFKKHRDINFNINDIDKIRILFLQNMTKEEERNKLYKLEEEVLKNGAEYYYNIVKSKNKDDDYYKYILSRRIQSFRYGLYPTTKKIILKQLSQNWIDFLNKAIITNKNYIDVFDKYKDNPNAFLYLDPPYLNSYNSNYEGFNEGDAFDENLLIRDNTIMYIHLLDMLLNAKCKILFSINDNALTKHLYKDYIKDTYNHKYSLSHVNIEKNKGNKNNKKHTNVLIITNF